MIKKIRDWIIKNKIPVILVCICAIALIFVFMFTKNSDSMDIVSATADNAVPYTVSGSIDNTISSDNMDVGDMSAETETKNTQTESIGSTVLSETTVITDVITQQNDSNDVKTEKDGSEQAEKGEPTEAGEAEKATVSEKNEENSRKSVINKTKDYCTFSISCHSVFDYSGRVSDSVLNALPEDGWIYKTQRVEFDEGESVFDILKRVCSENNIDIDYSYNPVFNTVYIKGINNLYEFDCGNQSGWLYMVNSVTPNCGCSSYTVLNGDVIEFKYSCKGFGADL